MDADEDAVELWSGDVDELEVLALGSVELVELWSGIVWAVLVSDVEELLESLVLLVPVSVLLPVSVLVLDVDAVRSEVDVSSIVSFCAHAASARLTAAAMLSK